MRFHRDTGRLRPRGEPDPEIAQDDRPKLRYGALMSKDSHEASAGVLERGRRTVIDFDSAAVGRIMDAAEAVFAEKSFAGGPDRGCPSGPPRRHDPERSCDELHLLLEWR